MKLLVGDKGFVDFSNRITITTSQRKRIVDFLLKKNFLVEVNYLDEVYDFRLDRLGSKFFMKTWTESEYKYLFTMKKTEEVAEILGRSWMSVDMQRGKLYPDFMKYTNANKFSLLNDQEIIYAIGKFLEEKKDLLVNKRVKRKKVNVMKKRVVELIDLLALENSKAEYSKSDKFKAKADTLITYGAITGYDSVEDYIQKTINSHYKNISEYTKELETLRGELV